jgi:hypothetical protein
MTLTDRKSIIRRTGRRARLARSLHASGGLSQRLPRWNAFDGRQSRPLQCVFPAGSTDAQDLMRLDSDKG